MCRSLLVGARLNFFASNKFVVEKLNKKMTII